MPKVHKRSSARTDLIAIWHYIAPDSFDAANRMLDAINEKLNALAQNPFLGRACPELAPDLRRLPVKSYVIFYRPTADGVEIVRVLHGARDIETLWVEEEGDISGPVH